MIDSIWSFVSSNAILVIVSYIVAGLIFTFVKWALTLWKIKNAIGLITSEQGSTDYLNARRQVTKKFLNCFSYPPTAKENAGVITAWAVFWPIVIIWTMFSDIIIEVSSYLVRKFQSLYQLMVKAILPE